MKIAFLTPEYPHPTTGRYGGLGTSIRNLALGLVAKGCDVFVLVYNQSEENIIEEDGIIIQRIENIKIKGLSWYFTRKKIEKIINNLYQNGKIEVVEAPDWTGITSFITPKKCPIVIRLHGSDTYFCHLDNRPVKWINKFHEKRALQKANGYLSVSKFTASVTNTLFQQNNPYNIIHNGVSVSDIDCTPTENTVPIILYFGTLIRKKGLLELPHIFNLVVEKYPEASLILVGKDAPDIITGSVSTWEMMQNLFSKTAKEKVSYIGVVPFTEIGSYIKEASVCVFPSFAEAFPVSWLEAMERKKAVVASNIGWGKEVIINGVDGFIEDPTNHEAFANCIITVIENKACQESIANFARAKIISDFAISKIADQNIAFYQNLIAQQ